MTDMTDISSTTVAQGGRMFDILCPPGGDSVALTLRDSAAIHLRSIDSEHATVLGTKVSAWPERDLAEELEAALKVDPYTLLLKAWATLRKVRDAIDKSAIKGEAQTVTLAKHEIDAKIEPSIVVSAFGVDCRAVKLTLTLAASLESAQLVFERRGLTMARMGKPTGTLSVAIEGQPISSGKRQLKFEPIIDFKPPLFLAGNAPGSVVAG